MNVFFFFFCYFAVNFALQHFAAPFEMFEGVALGTFMEADAKKMYSLS